jgi:hypothetical protein
MNGPVSELPASDVAGHSLAEPASDPGGGRRTRIVRSASSDRACGVGTGCRRMPRRRGF